MNAILLLNQIDTSTINILLPAAVGALATIVTAYFSFRVQRVQVQSQVVNASKAAAEAAEQQSWQRIKELMKIQEETMTRMAEEAEASRAEVDEIKKEMEKIQKEYRNAAATWDTERRELVTSLRKANEDLNELRDVLTIVRNENNQQKTDMEQLRGRIRDLEAENQRLKGGSTGTANPRSKL